MERKGFLITWLAVLVGSNVYDALVHQVLLADLYQAFTHVWRPEAEIMSMFGLMLGTSVMWSCIFVYMFGWARKRPGVMEGVRFGVCVGLFTASISFGIYVILPVSLSVGISWFVAELVRCVLLGALASVVYRPRSAAS